MKVQFACPVCDAPDRVSLDQASDWQCAACDHRRHFEAASPNLPECSVCGCHELYKQKDFNQRLGLTILVVGLGLSVITYGLYQKWLTYALLLGTAAIDGLLYLSVGDAYVCYRCGSYHQDFPKAENHEPFEITIKERHRQEQLRKERMKREA